MKYAQFFLPKQLVVLGQALGAARCTRLDLRKVIIIISHKNINNNLLTIKVKVQCLILKPTATQYPTSQKIGITSYLSSAETDHEVSNEGVLSLSGAMADHHTPAVTLSHLATKKHRTTQATFYSETHLSAYLLVAIKLLCAGHSRLQGLGDRADLVDLEQQAVAGLLGHTLGDALRVGDCEVVTHHLDAGAGCEVGPCLPVILVKGVLDGHD